MANLNACGLFLIFPYALSFIRVHLKEYTSNMSLES